MTIRKIDLFFHDGREQISKERFYTVAAQYSEDGIPGFEHRSSRDGADGVRMGRQDA